VGSRLKHVVIKVRKSVRNVCRCVGRQMETICLPCGKITVLLVVGIRVMVLRGLGLCNWRGANISTLRMEAVCSPETPATICHITRRRNPQNHSLNLRHLKISVRGSSPGGGEIFRTGPDRTCWPTSASCTMCTGCFLREGKAAGAWR